MFKDIFEMEEAKLAELDARKSDDEIAGINEKYEKIQKEIEEKSDSELKESIEAEQEDIKKEVLDNVKKKEEEDAKTQPKQELPDKEDTIDDIVDSIPDEVTDETETHPFVLLENRVTELEQIVLELKKALEPKTPTLSEIKKMLEPDLVVYANSIGVEATTKDLKPQTLQKVLEKLGYIGVTN